MGFTDQGRVGKALFAIADTVEDMNDDEQEVMALMLEIVGEVAAGVVRGQKIYGFMDLDNDDRNSLEESDEEDRDWFTYRLMHMTKERRRRARGH